MKKLIYLVRMDLSRAILSINFILATLFILLVMFISCSGFINDTSTVIYLLDHALSGSGSALFILCIAPILPYGMSFAMDMEDKALTFWIIRTGIKKYSLSKFISAAIAGFLSVSGSIGIFLLINSRIFTVFEANSSGHSYSSLLENNHWALYLFAIAAHYSLSGALFAAGSIAISAFIPNKFTVMVAPIVIYFVFMRLTDLVPIPAFLKASILVQGIYPGVSPQTAFLFKLVPVLCLLGCLLIITVKQIEKKVRMA